MKYAEFRGARVDVPQFVAKAGARFRKEGVYPICLECRRPVAPRLAEGPGGPSFAHFPGQAAGCDLASKASGRDLSALGIGDLDDQRGRAVRRIFLAHESLRAFALLTKVCSGTKIDFATFAKLIRRADGRGIWDFCGLDPWMMAFILPLLENFTTPSYAFHFTMRRGADETSLFGGSRRLLLDRVFTRSGDSMRSSRRLPNPLPVTPKILIEHGDASWISRKAELNTTLMTLVTP